MSFNHVFYIDFDLKYLYWYPTDVQYKIIRVIDFLVVFIWEIIFSLFTKFS